MRSGLKAFILVSRQFGVNVGANDIPESYKTEDREVSLRELAALAQKFGLKAKAGKVGEAQLAKLLSKRQQLLRLDNNRYIIALRYPFSTRSKSGWLKTPKYRLKRSKKSLAWTDIITQEEIESL